ECFFFDIGKNRRRTRKQNAIGRGDERKGCCDYFVAWPNAVGEKREVKRGRATARCDRMACFTQLGEAPFEFGCARSLHDVTRFQYVEYVLSLFNADIRF